MVIGWFVTYVTGDIRYMILDHFCLFLPQVGGKIKISKRLKKIYRQCETTSVYQISRLLNVSLESNCWRSNFLHFKQFWTIFLTCLKNKHRENTLRLVHQNTCVTDLWHLICHLTPLFELFALIADVKINFLENLINLYL